MTPPARALWRFLRREGGYYVFATKRYVPLFGGWEALVYDREEHRVPVERFWGGAR